MSIHIGAKKGEIAETILLPGDPLRAKFIAENYLEDYFCYNEIRNMFGYTGYYKGKRISVQGTGMGIPSIGIYSHELITEYEVKNLVRVGSCGSLQPDVHIRDIILASGAATNSNFASQFNLPGTFSATASYELLHKAKVSADEKKIEVKIGNIFSTDIFYEANHEIWKSWAKMGCLAVEMEAAGLYMNCSNPIANLKICA